MSDIQFINGLMFKAPNPKAPEFVKASGSIKREDLIATLSGMEGEWINFDVKESKGGKWYAAVNTYKPNSEPRKPSRAPVKGCPQPDQGGFTDDEIPFMVHGKRAHWIA